MFLGNRPLITGIGLWTPHGADRESSWQGLVSGRSAIRRLSPPHWTGSTLMAGAPYCPLPDDELHGELPQRDPLVQLSMRVAEEALIDARLCRTRSDRRLMSSTAPTRIGVVFGTSKGGLHTFAQLSETACVDDASNLTDTVANEVNSCWLDVLPDAACTAISREFDCRGPSLCPVLACATGLAACQQAADLVQHDVCDVVIAGSADASLQPALLGAFQRLGVLARCDEDAATACRPFDRDRSGFVVGEGAACLIFESPRHALSRQATWYAEWLGGRSYSDTAGLTQLDPQGESLIRLLSDLTKLTLQDGTGVPDYANLHGTGTQSNDRVESLAMRTVLQSQADRVACSSLKGGIGHLLGAAGSVELAATVLALRDQIIPPTVNLLNPDPTLECLNFTPREACRRPINVAWKLSLGFGGHLYGAAIGRRHGAGDRTISS